MRLQRFLAAALAAGMAVSASAGPQVDGPFYRVTCDGEEPVLVGHPSQAGCLEACGEGGFSAVGGVVCYDLEGREISASTESARLRIAASTEDIRESCANQWAENFALQKVCVDQNTAGRDRLLRLSESITDSDLQKAAQRCIDTWASPSQANFSLAVTCYEQQATALEGLRAR